VLVVLVDGEVAGSATLEFDARIEPGRPPPAAGEAHLRMLGVAPRFRRRGAGEALMRACIDAARRRGRVRLTLHTTPAMLVAQRMYERFGFRRGTPVVEDGMDLIPFDLDLSCQAAESSSG
jgi:ribosomal protein S18 acetylase RimI-like enzyme